MSVQSEIDRINGNIAATYSTLNEAGATLPAAANSNNLSATAASIKAVLYGKAQSLTTAQQQQARNNIGAISEIDVPKKGVDYFTPADQESIVQQVIAALGTPVFGTVDADNNIILTGELANGTYTVKYEDADGNVVDVGTIAKGGIANLADPTSAEWVENRRINSSGSIVEAYAGSVVANFIPCKAGDVVRVKGIDIAYYQAGPTDGGKTNMWYYKADKTTSVTKIVVVDNTSIFVNSGDTWTFTVGSGVSSGADQIAYVRPFGRYMSGYTKNDVVITVNQEIP